MLGLVLGCLLASLVSYRPLALLAAGRLGRLTLWGADMWIKDQYVDIFCRWVYLPLYAILAAISLNEST